MKINGSSSWYRNILERIRETIKDKRSEGITITSLAYELDVTREHLSRMLNMIENMNAKQLTYLLIRLEIVRSR